MSLTPGTRLGPYEITAPLGAGGMGEVYRATDTTLRRQVALKLLPEAFASDPERLARFEREGRTLAALNHPYIAQIYGLEKSVGQTAIVMELVEGPTLADRIAQGPIAVDEALVIAKQIAEALEAAHERGIIHRDLKPANIKVKDDGTVKVLDFGLAKAMEPSVGASPGVSQSPTITTPAMTQAGMILGTAAYMSPEQAKGRAADQRSDIWAFGAVLYEMLTGQRAFPGDDTSEVFAVVIKMEPSWQALPTLPPLVGAFVKQCLRKDPPKRLASIQDMRLALEGAFEGQDAPSGAKAAGRKGRLLGLVTAASLGALGALAIGWWFIVPERAGPDGSVRRLVLDVPRSVALPAGGGSRIALSPDGEVAVYLGVENGTARLYQRRLDQLGAVAIPGTDGATEVAFFSWDGQWLAFARGNVLMRVSLVGGSPIEIVRLPLEPRGGVWGQDNQLVLGLRNLGIGQVAAGGGELETLTTPEGDRQYWYPQILPGARAVLYTSSTIGRDRGEIRVLDLDTQESRTEVAAGVAGHYVSTGHLLFMRSNDLWAVRFDLAALTTSGEPVLVERGIRVEPGGAVQYAISDDGALVYMRTVDDVEPTSLVWVDRNDGREAPAWEPAQRRGFSVSPDGSQVAAGVAGDAWIYDLRRGSGDRITFDSDYVGPTSPPWTPDGTRIAFGPPLSWTRADGAGGVERLDPSGMYRYPLAFTPDGKALLYEEQVSTGGGFGLGMLSLEGDRTPTVLVDGDFEERNGAISPDGRWLAYNSDETGRHEVYVHPFPTVGDTRWLVSSGGGEWPVWNPVANELFYRNDRGIVVVEYTTEPTFGPGQPTLLVERTLLGEGIRRMDVSRDGQRFLVLGAVESEAEEQPSPLVVVENFPAELQRLLPTN